MSVATLSFDEGEMSITGLTASQNWWVKTGRVVEFEIVTTGEFEYSSNDSIASGLPKPYKTNIYSGVGNASPFRIVGGSGVTSGVIRANANISNTSGNTYVFHGVYISES